MGARLTVKHPPMSSDGLTKESKMRKDQLSAWPMRNVLISIGTVGSSIAMPPISIREGPRRKEKNLAYAQNPKIE